VVPPARRGHEHMEEMLVPVRSLPAQVDRDLLAAVGAGRFDASVRVERRAGSEAVPRAVGVPPAAARLDAEGAGDRGERIRHPQLGRGRIEHERMSVVEAPPRGFDLSTCQPELVRSGRAPQLDEARIGPPPDVEVELVHQCRKWRRPVTTIAPPAASTAAATSSSRTEPPGWMIALTPASSASFGPSGKGKKASEARTAPPRSCPSSRAFATAIRTASTRDIWPAPMPIV